MAKLKLMLGLEEAELEVDKVTRKIEFYESGTPAERALIDSQEPEEPEPEEDTPDDTEEASDYSTADSETDDTEDDSEGDNKETPDDYSTEETDEKSDDDSEDKEDDSEEEDDDSDPVKENEDNSEAKDESVEAATSLEAIVNVLEDSLRYGGMSPSCLAVTSIALKSSLNRIGFVDKNIKSVGLEDFSSFADSVSSKYNTTKDVLGHISNILSSVWNAVDKSISFSIDILSRIAKKFHTGFNGYLKECQTLKESFKGIKDISDIDDKRYTDKDVIKNLYSGTSFDPLKSLTVLSEFSKSYFSNIKNSATTSTDSIYNIIEAVKTKDFNAPNRLIKLPPLPTGVKSGSVDGYQPESSNLESYVYKDKLPGDSLFIVFYPKSDLGLEELDEAQRVSKFLVGIDMSSSNTHTEVDYLDNRKITVFIEKMEEIAREGLASTRVFYEFLESKKRLASELKKLEKLNGYEIDKHKEKNLDVKEYIRAISSTLQRYDNTYINGSAKIAELMIRTLKSGTKYASDSIKFYL